MPTPYKPPMYYGKGKTEPTTNSERPEWRKLYTKEWFAYSWRRLQEHPRCVYCGEIACGHDTRIDSSGKERRFALGVTDHIKPHKGDVNLFWDEINHQTLCIICHNRKSARE